MIDGVFIECFGDIEDPRVDRTKKHLLLDVFALALFGVLAGAQTFTEIEDFCCIHEEWLQEYLSLPNGIPSHDTFNRIFSAIAPSHFEEAFIRWIKAIMPMLPEGVIPIDGKTIKGSKCPAQGLKAMHIVSAWSCVNGISLGQLRVDEKTNEITVIPDLLKKIFIEGSIVTIDAMGCQKAIADQIIDQKGDYIFRVKENQGGLLSAIESAFELAEKNNYENMVFYNAEDEINNDHGRLESRSCIVLPGMYLTLMDLKWKGLASLIKLKSEREIHGEKSVEYRYYISSVSPLEAEKILMSIRSHWQIENTLHWILDVAYREDSQKLRDENAVLNMAWLRKMSLGLLKKAKNISGSIRRKQLKLWAKPQQLIDMVKN